MSLLNSAQLLSYLADWFQFKPLHSTLMSDNIPDSASVSLLSWYKQADILQRLRRQVGGNRDRYADMKDLVFYARTSKSTDLSDKAFSVLGLADIEIYNLRPDYRAPVKEVHKGLARALASQSLGFLNACQNPDRRHGLPSCAPNLADDWKAIPFFSNVNIHACVDSKRLPDCVFDEANDILVVKGYRLDVLLTVSEAAVHKDDTDEQLATICENWMNIKPSVSNNNLT